jgi:hypothetical protein
MFNVIGNTSQELIALPYSDLSNAFREWWRISCDNEDARPNPMS